MTLSEITDCLQSQNNLVAQVESCIAADPENQILKDILAGHIRMIRIFTDMGQAAKEALLDRN